MYITNLNEFVDITHELFEQGIKVLGNINQIELVLLKELFKTMATGTLLKIKAPFLNSKEHYKIFEEKNLKDDENKWLFDN